ncbi:bacterial Ig-like domain-containing protein, partial [Lentilactobacillus sp. G22-6]|uniref:bacterial Ig-like domain-containing protein n=2 Tax=Lentilactobacillus dabitei TaxID=2831523 RepID=UPI001C270841
VYNVTYQVGSITKTAKITVLANQTAVNVKDLTLYTGDSFSPKDAFVSAKDKDGNAVDFTDVKISGDTVKTGTPGVYNVTYQVGSITKTAKITVLANQTALNVKDLALHVGDTFANKDAFINALDKDGNAVDFNKVTVGGDKVDTTKASTYTVTYTYAGITKTATVTVADSLAAISAHDATIIADTQDSFDTTKLFDSATNHDGQQYTDYNAAKAAGLTITGTVDPTKVGDYPVELRFDGVTKDVTVHVVKNQSAVNAKNIDLYVGDNYTARDGFVSAKSADGSDADFSKVTVGGDKVDTSKPGIYKVTYTYEGQTATSVVTVNADQTALKTVPTIELTNGGRFNASQGFISATTKQGQQLNYADVVKQGLQVTGADFDTTKAGTYTVTYSFNGKTATTRVIVDAAINNNGDNNDGTNTGIVVTPSNNNSSGNSSNSNGSNTSGNSTTVTKHPSTPNVEGYKSFQVYNKRSIYRYKSATFSKKNRIKGYKRTPRYEAANFRVVAKVTNKQGHARYKLSDGSYITANSKYVASLYWRSKHATVYSYNPKGLYEYKGTRFNKRDRTRFVRQGTKLHVAAWYKRSDGMNRFKLTNGRYVSANKQFSSIVKPHRLGK